MKTLSLKTTIVLIGFLLLACSCNEKSNSEQSHNDTALLGSEQTGLISIADQIVYDVEIINPTPDDEWTEQCLAGLDHETLVNFIIDGIYSNDFTAYEIFVEKKIAARKIRSMEENGEFSRSQIGKIQFQEEWILDTLHMTYYKKVTEVRMGLQNILEDGTLANYKPLFRVVL